ncbi:mannose-6-phosphate isomerase, type 3 [Methylobacterium phyllostachyos]|uniref:Mannose-6-phosphate isomerase, type 3 n=1 Tax=Methylobacterium phyllostachyos TaxID=582672 RepID=A0A1H0I4T8_9HYPH|nr:AGE family epimerase/isomerase [Methylobacterium phyllostachyos]SDO26432.1 mannose-6-phosphate isomerase, type 3 [Methylobacterium phyllostachyos]
MTAVVRLRQWLQDSALPLWSTIGVDGERGFVERLTSEGVPDLAASKRLRVQARQIYVFSHAHVLGLAPNGLAVATLGHDFVMRHGFPDGVEKGAVHALAREGAVRDAKRDTYDHAFLLFAFSWYYRASGRPEVRATIRRLGDAIWALLRHPGGAGFAIDDSGLDDLHQNPHMHLFEAVLAAYEATGDAVFLDRAHELFALFRSRMFDPERGVLREFYDARWQPVAGEAGQIVEPGHHCEWIWLLKRYADCAGETLCDEAYQLNAFVERYGRPGGGILLCDEVWIDGRAKKLSTRSWPQTEAVKADIALAEARGEPLGPRADATVDALLDTFLDRWIAGAWIDWVDVGGTPLVQAIPASTLYHIFLASSEYLRARNALAPS